MKKPLKTLVLGAILLLCCAACMKSEEPSYQIAAAEQLLLDVSYGNDAKQTMDVYLPPNRTSNASVIIFVHGGSFIEGDKKEFSQHAKYLASSGYVVLNVNYRLVNSVGLFDALPQHRESAIKVKDQLDDISNVVDYAIAHAKTWVMSSSKIAIVGHSAGGTLALLYAYDIRNSQKIRAVSNIAGALDMVFTDLPNWQLLPQYVLEGGYRYTGVATEVANASHFKAISPLYVANNAKKVPTLNLFPQYNDVLGLPKLDITTYNKFTNKLNELGVPNEFVFVSGANHYFSRTGDWQLVLDKTVAYFNQNLK